MSFVRYIWYKNVTDRVSFYSIIMLTLDIHNVTCMIFNVLTHFYINKSSSGYYTTFAKSYCVLTTAKCKNIWIIKTLAFNFKYILITNVRMQKYCWNSIENCYTRFNFNLQLKTVHYYLKVFINGSETFEYTFFNSILFAIQTLWHIFLYVCRHLSDWSWNLIVTWFE